MRIAVAGPYSAESEAGRRANLRALEETAAALLRRGHVPVVGVTAALPIVELADPPDRYEAIMAISLAVVEGCDAILMVGRSPGADREMELLRSRGRPVFHRIDDVPPA